MVDVEATMPKFSSDSETEELLLAAVDGACVRVENYTAVSKDIQKPQPQPDRGEATESSATTSTMTMTTTERPKCSIRQRTLVEMLDEAYTHRTGPASKKHCASKPLSGAG